MNKVRFEQSDALGLLTLANPPLNLFDEELITDLRAVVDQAKQLPLRALLVRADGKHFSGGADVAIFKGRTADEARLRFTSHLRTIADLEELPFPTIAAVQGACMAAGLELVGVRPHLGGFFGAFWTGRSVDRNDHAAGRYSTPGRACRPGSGARNRLHR